MPPISPEPTRAGTVAIIGRPNVGKSTLLNALLGERIAITSRHPQTTRDAVRGILTVKDTQYVLVDTPGLHTPRSRLGRRMNAASRDASHEADVVVLVVECPPEGTTPRLIDEDRDLAGQLPSSPAVLAMNKIDRVTDKAALLPFIEALSKTRDFAAIIPLSARREDGIDRLLAEVRALLPERPFLYEADTLSVQPVRFFVAEFVREQILRQTKQEVPHGVAVVVERFDEDKRVPWIDVVIHVAREAHKKILVGAHGQMMKTIGTAARARVEEMLGKQVRLQLWVRATPGWMDDEARLAELGYGSGNEDR